MQTLIDKLEDRRLLSKEEYQRLLFGLDEKSREYLAEKARAKAKQYYGNKVYTRGLIEFSNYCRNDCYYCGIRKGNSKVSRYHLTKEDILECCRVGYDLDFRTFVLQGGEDLSYSVETMTDIIQTIRRAYPDCAITLSIGERDREEYLSYYQAGANRFLLRHETADESHYSRLHPETLTLSHRMECLKTLKEIGFQTGSGFMVGSPYQTLEHLAGDLLFLAELKPHMVGIGPFIPHKDTPFHGFPAGKLEMTLSLISILRLMFPNILIPATTALGTVAENGRELGILAGANVVMPNLSPLSVRKKYLLYDNKICTGDEAAESRRNLEKRMETIGYRLTSDRGDCEPESFQPIQNQK